MRRVLAIALLLAACGSDGGGKDVAAQPDGFVDDLLADESTGPEVTGDVAAADGESEAGAPDITEPDGEAPDAATEIPDFAAPDVDPEEWAKQYGQGCLSGERVGLFRIEWMYATSGVSGTVDDSANTALIMENAGEEGPCMLLKRVEPFCDPECDGTIEQCAPGGKCVPHPKPLSAGTVSVKGLVKPVSVEFAGIGYSYTDFEGLAWTPGSNIELSASGADVEPFALQGGGVEPLAIPFADWALTKGSPMTIQWTASEGPGKIQVELNLMQHAANSHDLVCVLDDTGEFTIPQSLTDKLINLGVYGAPIALVFRRTVDSVQLAHGCVELLVKASGTAYVTLK